MNQKEVVSIKNILEASITYPQNIEINNICENELKNRDVSPPPSFSRIIESDIILSPCSESSESSFS